VLKGKGVLLPFQEEVLRVLGQLPEVKRFYLTGGTALAEFYLGHRLSFDLDLFTTEEPLVISFSRKIEQSFTEQGWQVKVVRRFTSFVEITVGKGDNVLRLDLGVDTPFRFGAPLPTPYGVLVNDFEDLKAEKTLAYYGRAEPRDAVDVYFLLKEHSIYNLMDLAAQKDAGFDPYWFAISLQRAQSFPDEIERWPVKMLTFFDPRNLKRKFLQLALEILQDIIGGKSRG